jgi:hypothetical protein
LAAVIGAVVSSEASLYCIVSALGGIAMADMSYSGGSPIAGIMMGFADRQREHMDEDFKSEQAYRASLIKQLDAIVANYVDDEVLYREALALGLSAEEHTHLGGLFP